MMVLKYISLDAVIPLVGLLKKTTGLMGLVVCESPHARLGILYTNILDVLEQIPKNIAFRYYTEQITDEKLGLVQLGVAYRKYTEQITDKKLGVVKVEPDVKIFKDQPQDGQRGDSLG